MAAESSNNNNLDGDKYEALCKLNRPLTLVERLNQSSVKPIAIEENLNSNEYEYGMQN